MLVLNIHTRVNVRVRNIMSYSKLILILKYNLNKKVSQYWQHFIHLKL